MHYTYTVQKAKKNRIVYRSVSLIFLIIAILQFIKLLTNETEHKFITILLLVFLGSYGVYLLRMSLRRQSFDITYQFDDEGIHITHRYGKSDYSYDDVANITLVDPDPDITYQIISFKIKKQVYTLPFTGKKEYCEKIYNYINNKAPSNAE